MPIRDIDQERATQALLGDDYRLAPAYSDLQRLHEQIDRAVGWVESGLADIKRNVESAWKPGEQYANGVVIGRPEMVHAGLGQSVLELPALIAELNATRKLICMLEKEAKETK